MGFGVSKITHVMPLLFFSKNNSRYAPVEHQKPVSTWILTSENQRYYLVISVYSRLAVLSKDQVPILHLA